MSHYGLTLLCTLGATLAMTLLALRSLRAVGGVGMLVAPLGAFARPAPAALTELRARLASAGHREPEHVDIYLGAHLLLRLLGTSLALALLLRFGARPTESLLACLAVGGGFLLAPRTLAARARARQRAIGRAMPNLIDLLVTCVDAGLSIEAAFERLARDLGRSEPVLADELRVTISEIAAGVPVDEAMRRLGKRTREPDMETLCLMVAQAFKLGARVAQILRAYATSSRRRRMARLEEQAGKIAARLTLPLALCLLPASLLAMLGPALVMIVRGMGAQ